MLNRLCRLRSCRLLAFLATLLLADVLPHGHVEASQGSVMLSLAATMDRGDGADAGAALLAHCSACHVARAMLPHATSGGTPGFTSTEIPTRIVTAASEGQHGQAPARPPRGWLIA